jgi:hypothetical protein
MRDRLFLDNSRGSAAMSPQALTDVQLLTVRLGRMGTYDDAD